MRGLLHHAALALLAILTCAGVARAFTPTSDVRYIQAIPGFPTSMKTAVPFQPFNESLQIIVSGVQLGGAAQESSILVDGIVGGGGAAAGTSPSFPFPTSAASVLDVHFDLAESSVFALSASVSLVQSLPGGGFFQLERTAPSPGTFVTLSGVGEFDQRVAMPPGSYRLQAAAQGGGNSGGSFDFDFRLVCASASPQDSDADEFVDACDICPPDFDPGQEDSDADGIGDACDVPEVIEQILDPAVYAVLGPNRAALAADGTAYVVSATNNRIFRIPPAGPASELWRGTLLAANVSDVAIGPDGFVYTAGGNAAKCYRIDPITGAATLVIGPAGDGVGNVLTVANRVAIAPDGRVFVSGRDSQNVFEIAVGGAITLILGPSGNDTTALGQPRALEVDAAGNLFVLASSGSSPRLFRVTPAHQVQLAISPASFPNAATDLALGPDGSIYVAGDGIFARRPSGAIEVLLPVADPLDAMALDVDASGVVHVVQAAAPTHGFRITPAGQLGPLIDPDGDGQGHPMSAAVDVVVSDGPQKRIVVVARDSANAFLITDASAPAVVPLFGPAGWGALAAALLGGAALARRR